MGLIGILIGLSVLIYFAYRGWSILILAPLAALIAALFAGEPLLAHWTITFMSSASGFLQSFFPLFLLGAIFGKLMDDSGSVRAIADWMMAKLGPQRAILAVVLAGTIVTYGGVSLFVAFFVLAPMGMALFERANIPRRLMPAAIVLGTSTYTMSALPGTPAIQNAIPMPFFGTTPFAAPLFGILASLIMFAFGMAWLTWMSTQAKQKGEGFDGLIDMDPVYDEQLVRERAAVSQGFDPNEMSEGERSDRVPSVGIAMLPLIVVVGVNMFMTLCVFPRLNVDFLSSDQWGYTSFSSVAGVWSVLIALILGILVLMVCNLKRLPNPRTTLDAGANASVLPILSVASLVGFGAVVASLPAFISVKHWVLSIDGGPLVSLALSTNILSALTGSASGGLSIALQSLGDTFLTLADQANISHELLHRVAVMSSGTLDSLPHNGAVITLLAVCGTTHKQSYKDIVMVGIVGPLIALVALILLA